VQTTSLTDYSDVVTIAELPGWVVYHAVNPNQVRCRLIVFMPEVSAHEDFRAAWRRDSELLRRLPHDGLPLILETGDDDGIVYITTELPPGIPLQKFLTTQSLTWDETADLGWQAASVIQHLHNSGLAHGGLDEQCFRITEQLRISLVDSGISRWFLAASDAAAAGNSADQYRADLIALGRLLEQLAATNTNSLERSSEVPQEWWDLIDDLTDASVDRFPATAREVQARLGSILLKDSGEAMDVIADRTGPGQSSRSIVDELLDTPVSDSVTQRTPPFGTGVARHRTILLLVLAVIVAVVIAAVKLLWK